MRSNDSIFSDQWLMNKSTIVTYQLHSTTVNRNRTVLRRKNMLAWHDHRLKSMDSNIINLWQSLIYGMMDYDGVFNLSNTDTSGLGQVEPYPMARC